MSAERISRPAAESIELVSAERERATLRDRPCEEVCDEFRALSYRVAQSEENQGVIMAELVEHRKILTKLDSRLDDQVSNQATLATTMASSSRTATAGGYIAAGGGSLLGLVEGGRVLGHALGWW